VNEGRFREDLYYRLNVFPMMWKPLRARPLDIWPLAEKLLADYSDKMKRETMKFGDGVKGYLTQYQWPGNVRELDNAIQRSLIMASNGVVNIQDFCLDVSESESWILASTENNSTPEAGAQAESEHIFVQSTSQAGTEEDGNALGKDLKLREYQIILKTLRQENGKKKVAAEKLGISPRTLRYKLAQMRENGIDVNAELAA
jgi:two-component system response regulator FlrC